MAVTEIGDPRLKALFGTDDPRDAGVRPTVRLSGKGLPPLVIGIAAALLALVLFIVLNERRASEPETASQAAGANPASQFEAPPPLYIPQVEAPAPPAPVEQQKPVVMPAPVATPAPRPATPQIVYSPQPVPQLVQPPAPLPPPRTSAGAPLVIDTSSGPAAAGSAVTGAGQPSAPTIARMRASAFANRLMTVPQGHLIPAVLETAFNSTQPGFARAIVSRDVRSFDGTNVLIPRGSRLIGEYNSEIAQGQGRAVIVWTRLIRPDGMTIAIDSPAVDTLGRGGVAASVNTHFFQRLGDALLQSTVGIGSALMQRSVSGPVVVIPGDAATAATAGQVAPTSSYVPTLTVPAGKSISVFVAHDLDFSAAGAPR